MEEHIAPYFLTAKKPLTDSITSFLLKILFIIIIPQNSNKYKIK